ncbi:MAG: PKD domain-containing protein [Actinomycetota bacterium]|nr:PKD domain-containing protein [Actinomycetota bacterium]
MSPSSLDTASDAHALVTARDGAGRLLAVDLAWGDGKTLHFSPGPAACPRTTHFDGNFPHRYTSPGSYTVQVTVTTGDCAAEEKMTRSATVTVTSAPSPTPASPSPRAR